MSDPAVLVERDGHVVTVTLNRPDKRNAFNAEVLVRCCDAWDLIDGDDDIRVAILTGAGGDFSAGADLDRLVGAMLSGKPAENEFEERIRQDPGSDLQGLPEGVPHQEAAHRRGRGLLLRRRPRDPAGHRHPGRRPRGPRSG